MLPVQIRDFVQSSLSANRDMEQAPYLKNHNLMLENAVNNLTSMQNILNARME